jgi:hypothetical protein
MAALFPLMRISSVFHTTKATKKQQAQRFFPDTTQIQTVFRCPLCILGSLCVKQHITIKTKGLLPVKFPASQPFHFHPNKIA